MENIRKLAENNEKNNDCDTEYFVYNNYKIKVREHFPEEGKSYKDLIEDLILYLAKSRN